MMFKNMIVFGLLLGFIVSIYGISRASIAFCT